MRPENYEARRQPPSHDYELNIGPNHPGIEGNYAFKLRLHGDTVIEGRADAGYLHRGFEKLMEGRLWIQNLAITPRICVPAPFFHAQRNNSVCHLADAFFRFAIKQHGAREIEFYADLRALLGALVAMLLDNDLFAGVGHHVVVGNTAQGLGQFHRKRIAWPTDSDVFRPDAKYDRRAGRRDRNGHERGARELSSVSDEIIEYARHVEAHVEAGERVRRREPIPAGRPPTGVRFVFFHVLPASSER